MNIFVTILFVLPLGLVTLYLYVSGVFTNRRAFQPVVCILLAFFALTITIGGIHHFSQDYNLPVTIPVTLSKAPPEP